MQVRRGVLPIVIAALVAALGLANLADYWLQNLVREDWPAEVRNAFPLAAAAIIGLAVIAIFLARARWRGHAVLAGFVLVLAIAASFAPRAADFMVGARQTAERQATGADAEMQFQSDYLDRSDDVDDRIAAKKPYSAAEALDFLDFAAHADLSWESLPDHTPEAFALVENAIEGGILDPNAITQTAPTPDSPVETLTVAFYEKRIRPFAPRQIEKHNWDVLQILVSHGADLTGEGGAAVSADLAKRVTVVGRFVELG